MKKNRVKGEFLEQLRKVPIVQVACERVGISRNTVYRWRKEDSAFCKEMDIAIAEGEALVNDMSESQLISMIREKSWPAISFWLRKRSPKFRDRIEVTTNSAPQDELSPEQETVVKEALRLASIAINQTDENNNDNNHGN